MQAVLDSLGSAVGAAEAHGCLCGALCVREGYATPEWIAELTAAGADGRIDERSRRMLHDFHLATLEALQAPDFGFAPLIPDVEVALDQRVEALAAWSGGFLYGIGAGRADSRIDGLADVGEVLRDFSEIARAQLAFEELAELRAREPGPGIVVH